MAAAPVRPDDLDAQWNGNGSGWRNLPVKRELDCQLIHMYFRIYDFPYIQGPGYVPHRLLQVSG